MELFSFDNSWLKNITRAFCELMILICFLNCMEVDLTFYSQGVAADFWKQNF